MDDCTIGVCGSVEQQDNKQEEESNDYTDGEF
jgi:hypothetical protein